MEEHFDEALGGNEVVPSVIYVEKFAQARCQEIVALNSALEQAQKGGLIFQRLPKAMRRRVMSHHSKRMPRRLQTAHAKQLERNGVPPKIKRPSRKFRRRPQNLLQEYNRRQRKHVWLETHIWHAKRFHMTEKWGYKLADFPNAKSFRACYRASANHCLLQDISYYCCIEISGPQEIILEGLNCHTSTECGLTFGAQAFLSGCREGSVTFFHKGTFPFGAVGTIRFLWKAEENAEAPRTLWLWVHPAIHNEVLECLVDSFGLNEEVTALENSDSEPHEGELKKLEAHHIFDPFVHYVNSTKDISLVLLKDKLNRFRLTGPLSLAILVDALNVSCLSQENNVREILKNKDVEVIDSHSDEEEQNDIKTGKKKADINKNQKIIQSVANCSSWWKSYYKSKEQHEKALNEQRNFWISLKGMYSPAQLPPHQVVALTVLDPRYQLPSKRKKVVPDPSALQNTNMFTSVPKKVSLSPIWESDIRFLTSTSKLSNSELANIRTQTFLVPGFSEEELGTAVDMSKSLESGMEPSHIPLMLLQRPGSQDPPMKRLGFGSGWDVVLPAGWAMPLWTALIFRGARPGGLKEASTFGFESGDQDLTELFAPDTNVGQTEAIVAKQCQADKYFRLPPNKRPNFIKFGVGSPFACCWNILMSDWCQNKQREDPDVSFYVLRNRVKLDALKYIINSYKSNSSANGNMPDRISQFSSLFSNMNHDCLVPVRIESLKKGCPVDCAAICIPDLEDFKHLRTNPSFEGPVEPMHNDDRADERKVLRKQHQKELKRLRKQRIRKNIKLKEHMDLLLEREESIADLVKRKKDKTSPTKKLVDNQAEEMRLLWVPEPKSVKDSCSRTIVGFVYKGDFAFSEAHGIGLGYVPFPAFIHLVSIWKDKPIVLFRNPNTVQYRFAVIKVS